MLVSVAVADRPASLGASHTAAASFDSVRTDLSDYIWPTDASTRITSSFAEYRSTHFHGGIDISTNGQTGYKAFAVRDGYVYKIVVAPNGYGKMLYLRHNDGYVSTYAHLKGFNEEISRVVREEQYRKGSYPVDLTLPPGQITVKKGDVVAYTGDTGFGPPHLHFEIRDENLNPVNPLLLTNFTHEDNIAPAIRRFMVEPLDASSTVEQKNEPRYYSRFPGSKKGLRLPQTIRLHGRIGFGVEALDRAEGSWSRSGIHRMELYVDDRLTYAMQLDRIPMLESKMILLAYDLPTIRDGKGKFQKLYIDEGNDLPIYENRPVGSGIIVTDDLPEGMHDFRVVCMDMSGNSTKLEGTFIANHRPRVAVRTVDSDGIVLVGEGLENVARCTIYGKKNFSPVWSQHTLEKGRFEQDGTGIELPVDTKPYDIVKIVVESKSGSQSAPLFCYLRKPDGPEHKVFLDHEVVGNSIRVTVSSAGILTAIPAVVLTEGTRNRPVPMEAVDLSTYVGVIALSDEVNGRRILHADAEVNRKTVTADDDFEVFPLPSKRTGSFETGPGGLHVVYDSAAVYSPLFINITGEPGKHGEVYSLEPQDVLLSRGITVTLPAPAAAANERVGLYFRASGSWVFQTSQVDPGGKSYSALLDRTLGDLALFADDQKPSVGRLKVLPRGGKLHVAFRYTDNLSGVDANEIKLYIDDALAVPEVDGEKKRASYESSEPLPRGKHRLVVSLRDRAGNLTEEVRTFTVR